MPKSARFDPDESLDLLNILRSFSGVSIETPKVSGAVAVAPTDLHSIPRPPIWCGMAEWLYLRASWLLGRVKIARHWSRSVAV